MAHLTENAIMGSFVKLLSEKPFDKITVTDIVEDCQITRRTFYYHYADLYELTKALFHTETERAIADYEETGSWEECFIRGCRFIMENRRAVYHIFKSVHRAELADQFLIPFRRQHRGERRSVSIGDSLFIHTGYPPVS